MKWFMEFLKKMSLETLDGYVDDLFISLLSTPIVMIDAADEVMLLKLRRSVSNVTTEKMLHSD